MWGPGGESEVAIKGRARRELPPRARQARVRLRCPWCGAVLMREGMGEAMVLWCSRQGSPERPGCSYGVWSTVTLSDWEAEMRQLAARGRGKRIVKRICPVCWGSGYVVGQAGRERCARCGGRGEVEEEIDVLE
jgi:hypothetical protein